MGLSVGTASPQVGRGSIREARGDGSGQNIPSAAPAGGRGLRGAGLSKTDAPGMRRRLSPTADVPSHTSGAAMCPEAGIYEVTRSPRRCAIRAGALAVLAFSAVTVPKALGLTVPDKLLAACRRGDRVMGWMAPLRHLGARVLVGSSSSTRVSSLRASPITCSISIPTTFANTPRNSVGWPSSVR